MVTFEKVTTPLTACTLSTDEFDKSKLVAELDAEVL